jgi:parallel beta-helix repeat protein
MKVKRFLTGLLASAVTFFAPFVFGAGPTPISGNQSGTLYLTNSPYIVTADILVPVGQTLTIEPGVELQFTNVNIGAFIDGTLIARGASGSPILFTSDKGAKQPGQWKVLQFGLTSTTNCILENCVVECAGATAGGFSENIRVNGPAMPLLTNCTIRLASGNGIALLGADARVRNCTFINNTNFAIVMRADSLPVFRNNTASGNGKNAIGIFGHNINRSGTWVRDNIPYTIYEEASVNNGVTLTIEPGTVVQFERVFDGFYVDGTLVARGTSLNPIVFTSDETVKQPGQWRVIQFRSTASTNSVMENCIVECCASLAGGYSGSIQFDSAPSVLITNCIVRSSFTYGLTINASDPRIYSCIFSNNGATNGGFAVAMRADCLPVFRNNTASGNGKNAIGIFGYNINRSGTWVRDNIPYTIYEEASINNGVTLTIEPGTVVQFERVFDGFYVDGTLVARGTSLNPIVFTSDETVKQPGQWRVIQFRSTASTNSVMENCIVECGASSAGGYFGSIQFDSAPSVLITNCIIRSSFRNGLAIYASDPRIYSCIFTNNGATNGSFAVAMRADCLPLLRNNTASGNGKNAIGIFGYSINRTGMWVRDNIPYTIYEEAGLNSGVTLTIEPGTVVQFERVFDGFYVDGSLVARGTSLNPIVFTSDETVKQPGQWRVFQFRSTASASSILENCIVECGASLPGGYSGSLQFDSAPPILITNCTIRYSTNDGIYCSASSPLLHSCRIVSNGRDGVRTANGSMCIVTNSLISGNAGFGVNNLDTSKIIKAEGNYWGHASGPFDNSNADGLGLTNSGGLGDKVSEYVDWSPFLNGSPGNGEPPAILSILVVESAVILSWPYGTTGYSLQYNTNLGSGPNSWIAVTNVPVLIGGRYTVTTSSSDIRQFYRLIK